MGGKRQIGGKRKTDKRKIKNKQNIRKRISRKNKKYQTQNARQKPRQQLQSRQSKLTTNKEEGIYRYSVAYDSGRYGKTFRAEVYLNHQENERRIRARLDAALHNHMRKTNKGLNNMFRNSHYIGFEAEKVGSNDKRYLQLNRIYYETG